MFFFLMLRRPPRSTQSRSSAASDVYKRQVRVLLGRRERDDQRVHQALGLAGVVGREIADVDVCLLYTSPSPRDRTRSRMPSSA